MRVSCPSCGATYDVPDSVLASGSRTLRCARCAHEWIPPVPPAEPDEVREPLAAPVSAGPPVAELDQARGVRVLPPLVASPPLTQDREDDEAAPSGLLLPPNVAVAAAWALSLTALAGMGLAAYLFRGAVQSAWPPSQLVYAALGLS